MKYVQHQQFTKHFQKRILNNHKLVKKYVERLELFINNPKNRTLKDHALTGNKKEYRSFWITGDIRVTYKVISNDLIQLYDIGSHNQVY